MPFSLPITVQTDNDSVKQIHDGTPAGKAQHRRQPGLSGQHFIYTIPGENDLLIGMQAYDPDRMKSYFFQESGDPALPVLLHPSCIEPQKQEACTERSCHIQKSQPPDARYNIHVSKGRAYQDHQNQGSPQPPRQFFLQKP